MISEIRTITRLIASVEILEIDSGSKDTDVEEYYKTQYVYPVRDSFIVAEEFCIQNGLLKRRKDQLKLSNLGRIYLRLCENKDGVYILEPNKKQKQLLSREVFLVTPMLDLVKNILYTGINGELYLSKKEAETLEDKNFFNLLIQMGILIEEKDVIMIDPQYMELLEIVISNTVRVITPEEFENSEANKMEIAKIAEDYVVESERDRLKNIGALQHSKDVEHVALKNVAAGYDIASFKGKISKGYDRFIEVKAGHLTPIRFFLSKNEVNTARRLKKKYFIYYVCVKDKKALEIYIFQDPIHGIMKDNKFEITTDTYEVQEK